MTATGVANRITLTIAPSRPHWNAPTLQIAVSPTIQRSLLDIVEAGGAQRVEERGADATVGTEGLLAASDLMAALALAKFYAVDGPERQMLDERIDACLGLLIAGQRDGAWSIDGRPSTVATNALAYWSLVLADKAGFDVPRDVLDAALGRLRGSAGGNREGDLETKAVVLHALAISGKGDFALANQLLRDRKLLSPLGRAYLALALLQMDRKETAADVMQDAGPIDKASAVKLGDAEAHALTALALLALDPSSTRATFLVEAIHSERKGPRWTPERATGPAVLAAATWLAETKSAARPYRLTITVNGKPVKTLDLGPQGPTQTVDVPTALLVEGPQRIELRASGPARFAYRCMLGGVDPAEFVEGRSAAWSIGRWYEPGPMEIDENQVPRGFSIVVGDPSGRACFSNVLTHLPAARRGNVELQIELRRGTSPISTTISSRA